MAERRPPQSASLPWADGDGSEGAAEAVLQGLIDVVTYHDEASLYTVLRIKPEKGYEDPAGPPENPFESRVTAVGAVPEPLEGLRVRLSGRWDSHKKHGRQFAFDAFEVLPPADAAGLVRYLSSKAFPGIGEVLAARIVAQLGEHALDVIRDTPERLREVPGLRASIRDELAARVKSELAAHQTRAFLIGLGLGPHQSEAVLRRLGPECEAQLRVNPYLLMQGIRGIGFQIADRAAHKLGVAKDSPERARAALVHTLEVAAGDGHSLLPYEALLEQAQQLLRGDIEKQPLELALVELVRSKEVVLDEQARFGTRLVYLPMFHACEQGLARSIARQLASPTRAPLASAAELAAAEARAGIELHARQREAVLGLLSTPLGLLTGGPGVGKTTIVRLVVALAEAAGAKVALCSPTGRAAKRLAEATGREAKTIHRLLGFDPQLEGFAHDEQRPLRADLLVVDELSMLDVVLAHQLFKAIDLRTRVLLVGDPDQLPSVTAGNVLADLLGSERVPTFRLTQIYRQDEHSLIVENAHRLLRGEWPVLPERGDTASDFYFFPAEDEHAAADRLIEVVTQRIPQRFGLDWTADVQVLAPMYRGECGVDALNERLRAALAQSAGPAQQIELRGRTWRVGERVIHTKNDYDKQVFNGDMGRVLSIAREGDGLMVRYPEQDVHYAADELGDLQPAFAITVHRSQGGEFPAVVMPLVPQHYLMLQRHVLYTAITRAKKLVVLVGTQRALKMAIDNAELRWRESALRDRVRALVKG